MKSETPRLGGASQVNGCGVLFALHDSTGASPYREAACDTCGLFALRGIWHSRLRVACADCAKALPGRCPHCGRLGLIAPVTYARIWACGCEVTP